MQTVIQVVTTGRGSLRNKIMSDPQLKKFELIPTEHFRAGRPHGWAKIHSAEAHGVIIREWHGGRGLLFRRVGTRLENNPTSILGVLFFSLLPRHSSRILAI